MLSFFLQDKIFHQLSYFSALFELLSIFHIISKLDTVLFSDIVWFILLLCFPLSRRFYVCYGLNLVLAFHGVIHGLLLIAVTKVSRHRFLHTLFKCRFLRMFLIISFILPIAWLPHLANFRCSLILYDFQIQISSLSSSQRLGTLPYGRLESYLIKSTLRAKCECSQNVSTSVLTWKVTSTKRWIDFWKACEFFVEVSKWMFFVLLEKQKEYYKQSKLRNTARCHC